MCPRIKVPFNFDKKEAFSDKLSEWIGDVFYDILPEKGYEVREEQIFTAFKLADAVSNKKIHLAEAGLGTGKTFAYLLTAVAYARFTGKPVVIACASTALQEQLAGPKGDIQTLSQLLELEIDARMAKDPRQYICDIRVSESNNSFEMEFDTMPYDINQWLERTKSGERSEMPLIPDQVWKQIGWDESLSCDMCSRRGFCKLIKAREHYRLATDLIIADHAVFFQDLWTREERIADRKIPLLPSYSAVVFDEGHKVILPSAMEAGQYLNQEEINHIIFSIEQIQGARKSLISMALELEKSSADFFKKINHCVIKDESSERLPIRIEDYLFEAASTLYKDLDRLLLEMQIEQELYIESLPENMVQAYEAQIERSMRALNRFFKNKSKDVITWMNQKDNSFWVVPRNLSDKLNKYLFQKDLSVVFTSATLSNDGDFSYFSRTLGLKKPSTSTVGSAFDYEEQVVVYLSNLSVEKDEDLRFEQAYKKLLNLLKLNEGRALVLTNSLEEVRKIRDKLKEYQFPFEILWEDQGDRGYLVQKFREEVSTVLIGANFWEGIDVPGEALTLLVIWQLPFPSLDPLIEVQRKEAMVEGLDPVVTVDYPEMGLKLKQGCGRLIRTKDDKGAIYIMDAVVGEPWENVVMGAIPHGAKVFFD